MQGRLLEPLISDELERLAQESGIETPTAEDLARLDRKRKGKKLSNQDWVPGATPRPRSPR